MAASQPVIGCSPRRRRLLRLARKGLWLGGVLAVLASLAIADRAGLFGIARQGDAHEYGGKVFRVVRVVDGDTLDVDHPDGGAPTTRVRLLGVDTPETVRPGHPVEHYGPEASAFLKRQAAGRSVRLRLDRARMRDRYGRLLAYVERPGGEDINLAIIATGHGYADPRFRHRRNREYRRAQKRASAGRLGLWADVTAEKLPYYYRKTLKLPPRR